MFLLTTLALLVAVNADCPAFNPMNEFTEKCLWPPIGELRRDMMEHCGLPYDADQLEKLDAAMKGEMPPDFEFPGRCGSCSFKLKCQTRDKSPDCFHVNGEIIACGNDDVEGAGEVCEFPKHPKIGCHYGIFKQGLMQCINAYNHTHGFHQTLLNTVDNTMSDMNCMEVDGKCHCCCSPKKPSVDGSTCIDYSEEDLVLKEECGKVELNDAMGDTCIWFGSDNAIGDFVEEIKSACKVDEIPFDVPREDFGEANNDIQLPPKCGHCSFKLNCIKRPADSKCYPFFLDKKPCGNDDCTDCGEPCEMAPLVVEEGEDECGFDARDSLEEMIEDVRKRDVNFYHGILAFGANFPHGKCTKHDGKCFCCCHPFEAVVKDGAVSCQVRPICVAPEINPGA